MTKKFVGNYLNRMTPGSRCREIINRWLKGKASPRLRHAVYLAPEDLLPKPAPPSGRINSIL
ncbi:hypothetical protein [Cupriavidus pauculus]|uniref:hypothetical protein n=1 Tax=Cupriavidus pauculus TaxID=82633 RepID=UPI0038572B2D